MSTLQSCPSTSWWPQNDRDIIPESGHIIYGLYTQHSPENTVCSSSEKKSLQSTSYRDSSRIPNYFGFWGQELSSYIWAPSLASVGSTGAGEVSVCVACKGNPYGFQKPGVT